MMIKQKINYALAEQTEGAIFEGLLVYSQKNAQTLSDRPVILVFHDWTGRHDFALQKAEALAALGYIGFAVDMYGHAQWGQTNDEKSALIQPLMQDRETLKNRTQAALSAVKTLDFFEKRQPRIGTVGFCFGGLCALDLARSGADIAGVVSFHGLLQPPFPQKPCAAGQIKAKVLALHGYDDPMVSFEQVRSFCDEMTHAQADWQLHVYGQTRHAFTNPQANDPVLGTVYQARADQRSWLTMKNFFEEIFGQ